MRTLLLVVALAIHVGTASGAELLTADGPTYHATMPDGWSAVVFTQNVNTTLIEPVQVACGVADTCTTRNWYMRRFYLTQDHGIIGRLGVVAVDFGVQQLEMADGSTPPPYTIQVRTFSIPIAAPLVFGQMRPTGTASVTITAEDVGTIIRATITGASGVDPARSDLVVAIDAPDGSAIGAGLQFRPGANSEGALYDACIAPSDCGISDPVAATEAGYEEAQTIFVVEMWYVDPIQNTSWGRVKSLYR